MNLEKILTYVGFCKRMGKLSYGATAMSEIKANRAYVALMDEGASENTQDKFRAVCNTAQLKLITLPEGKLGQAIGKNGVRVVAIKDRKLGKTITENLD